MNKAKRIILKNSLIVASIMLLSAFTARLSLLQTFQFSPVAALAQEPSTTLPVLAPSTNFEQNFRDVAQQAMQGVVRIDVTTIRKGPASGGNPLPFGDFFDPNFLGRNQPQEEQEFRSGGLGSGFVIERTGNTIYVMTNHHVAGTADEVKIEFKDGRIFDALIIASDERKDLSLLSADIGSDNPDIKALPLGDSDTLEVGDWIMAVGSPFGYDFTVTSGIVSAVGRTGGPGSNVNDFIQTDAAINQGNSGGPLMNMRGEVIGINTWIATRNGGSIGLSFSVPINNAKVALTSLRQGKSPEYGWVGVNLLDVRNMGGSEYAKSAGFSQTRGPIITNVFSGSPAEKAGLLAGDLVLRVNEHPINSTDRLLYIVGALPPNSKAEFVVIRNGKETNALVQVEARKGEKELEASPTVPWPGVLPFPLNASIRRELRLKEEQVGVVVAGVFPRSPLSVVRVSDVITAINGKPISSVQEFYAVLNSLPATGSFEITFLQRGQRNPVTATVKRD